MENVYVLCRESYFEITRPFEQHSSFKIEGVYKHKEDALKEINSFLLFVKECEHTIELHDDSVEIIIPINSNILQVEKLRIEEHSIKE